MKKPNVLNNRKPLVGLLAGLLALGSGCAWAQSTDTARIKVTGSIMGATCQIITSDIDLDIGTVNRSQIPTVGDFSDWSNIAGFYWGDCDASTITLNFVGEADANNPDLFAVNAGGATGVGIQLAHAMSPYENYTPSETVSIANPISNGQSWRFRARYIRTNAPLTGGPGNATITVLITYT